MLIKNKEIKKVSVNSKIKCYLSQFVAIHIYLGPQVNVNRKGNSTWVNQFGNDQPSEQ